MPDPIKLLLAMAAAAGVAALCVLALGYPWRTPYPKRYAVGWFLAIAAGFVAGAWMLDVRIKTTSLEVKDRFLLFVAPAIFVVEAALAVSGSTRWWTWIPRFGVALALARVLLDGSQFLSDPTGGLNTATWSTSQALGILTSIGVAIFLVWLSLGTLQQRTQSRSVPVALAVACIAVGVQTMNSGYVDGGQLAFPIAASLVAAALASFAVAGPPLAIGGVSVAFVGYVSVLVMGRFFGSLPTSYAIFWFAAPLLLWLPEVPWLCRIALMAGPLAPVLWSAFQEMQAQSGGGESPDIVPSLTMPSLPSNDDYEQFKSDR